MVCKPWDTCPGLRFSAVTYGTLATGLCGNAALWPPAVPTCWRTEIQPSCLPPRRSAHILGVQEDVAVTSLSFRGILGATSCFWTGLIRPTYLMLSLSCGGPRGEVASSQHFSSFLQMLVFSLLLLSFPFCKYPNRSDKWAAPSFMMKIRMIYLFPAILLDHL